MALVSQIVIAEQRLVVYNAHLESRGNDNLRCSQLSELCSDIDQLSSDTPVILAGDFNFDLCREPAAAVISNLQFDNPYGCEARHVGTVQPHLKAPRIIDWILTRGPLVASGVKLHDSIRASDHWPISISMRLESPIGDR